MNSKLYLSSTTALLCTGLQVLLLHWGPAHCFIWSSLRTVGASCSDSLDWAFTDTLLAVERGHYWCFRSTLQNQTDFKHQTEFKLLYLLPMHIIQEKIVKAGKVKKEHWLRSESNLATYHVLLLNPNLGHILEAAVVQKYFQALKRQSQLTNRNSIKHNGRDSKLGTLRGFPLATAG